MDADTKRCSFDEHSQYADLAAEVFSLLGDPTRVRIVLALRGGELSVNELAERVGKNPAGVSQHLAKLRWAKIVQSRQDGNRALYSLIDEHARRLVAIAVLQAQEVVGGMPQHTAADLEGTGPAASAPASGTSVGTSAGTNAGTNSSTGGSCPAAGTR
ncbi:ArsR/SmtB family transcription factor [Brachybacterium sp. DNPG3]